MPNGKPGDHPLTDILNHKVPVFSPAIDALIVKLSELMSTHELDGLFDWWTPPPLQEFERQLCDEHERRLVDARERGWEIDED